MSLQIERSLYWLCTKKRDLVFRSIEAAAEHVADTMLKMSVEGRWEDDFFKGLVKVERRNDNFLVTTMSEEMWMQATIKLWKAKDELKASWAREDKKILNKAKMAVVKEYGKYRDGNQMEAR